MKDIKDKNKKDSKSIDMEKVHKEIKTIFRLLN